MFNSLAKTSFSTGPDDSLLVKDVYGGITNSGVINTAGGAGGGDDKAAVNRPSMTSCCGCQGLKDKLPTAAFNDRRNGQGVAKDPFAAISKQVGIPPVTGLTNLRDSLPPPKLGTLDSLKERLGGAVSGFSNALQSLSPGQMKSLYNVASGVMSGNNPMNAIANIPGLAGAAGTNRMFPSSQIPQVSGLLNMSNAFINGNRLTKGNNGAMSIIDNNATTGILSSIMGQAGRLNIPGLLPNVLSGLPRTIIDRAISAALPHVIKSGSLGVFKEMTTNSTAGMVKNQVPNAIGTFTKAYSPVAKFSSSDQKLTEFKDMVGVCNAVDPNWNGGMNNAPGAPLPLYDMSAVLGGNKDMSKMLNTGAMLDRLKNPATDQSQTSAFSFVGHMKPETVTASSLGDYYPSAADWKEASAKYDREHPDEVQTRPTVSANDAEIARYASRYPNTNAAAPAPSTIKPGVDAGDLSYVDKPIIYTSNNTSPDNTSMPPSSGNKDGSVWYNNTGDNTGKFDMSSKVIYGDEPEFESAPTLS